MSLPRCSGGQVPTAERDVIRMVPRTGAICKAADLVRDMLDRENARRGKIRDSGLLHRMRLETVSLMDRLEWSTSRDEGVDPDLFLNCSRRARELLAQRINTTRILLIPLCSC